MPEIDEMRTLATQQQDKVIDDVVMIINDLAALKTTINTANQNGQVERPLASGEIDNIVTPLIKAARQIEFYLACTVLSGLSETGARLVAALAKLPPEPNPYEIIEGLRIK